MLKIKARELALPVRGALGLLIFIIVSFILSALMTEAFYSGRIIETQVPAIAAAVMFISALLGSLSAALGKGERL